MSKLDRLQCQVCDVLAAHGVGNIGVEVMDARTVGVMGDNRTYERVVILNLAEWLPHEMLSQLATEIVNNVRGINRVTVEI